MTGQRQGTVLVLRALNLGDLLVAVPALRGLRRRYPEHRLVLAASATLEPLARLTGAVDEVLPHRGLHPPAIRSPDVAVDLHGVLPESILALRGTDPGRLVAFACPQAGHRDGPAPEDIEHETVRWCRLVAWDGAAASPNDLLLARPEGTNPWPGATVVHPGAQYGSKCWPAERFAAVARTLAADGHDVVVTGSAAERPLARAVAAGAGLPDTAVLAGRTD